MYRYSRAGSQVPTKADPPHEVFVIRPVEEPFVVVYLALDRESLLADTIRDEFDCPRG